MWNPTDSIQWRMISSVCIWREGKRGILEWLWGWLFHMLGDQFKSTCHLIFSDEGYSIVGMSPSIFINFRQCGQRDKHNLMCGVRWELYVHRYTKSAQHTEDCYHSFVHENLKVNGILKYYAWYTHNVVCTCSLGTINVLNKVSYIFKKSQTIVWESITTKQPSCHKKRSVCWSTLAIWRWWLKAGLCHIVNVGALEAFRNKA